MASKVNEGPDPIAVADAVLTVVEDESSPIRYPVGEESTTFIPLVKALSDEEFEKKVYDTFNF